MSFVMKTIAYIVDHGVVKYENTTKGREKHISENFDLSEYNRPEYFEAPEKFYNLGLEMPDVRLIPIHTRAGIKITRFEFKSETDSGYPQNDIVTGRIFEARPGVHGNEAPVAIIAHGWREAGAFTRYHYTLGMILARYGINCVFYNQPYHGPRRPEGSRIKKGNPLRSSDQGSAMRNGS